MSGVTELTRELEKLEKEQGIEISAVITRSGAPIAWHLPAGASAETIATLSATIFGASEVIYTGSGLEKPKKVTVETSGAGTMIVRSLGRKAILLLMSAKMGLSELDKKANDAEARIREVMQNE